jgi:hypothetical protein
MSHLRTEGDFCHQGQEKEIAPKFKIVVTYWHDHSLESSWGAFSDGTISFSIQPLHIFWASVLKELRVIMLNKKLWNKIVAPSRSWYLYWITYTRIQSRDITAIYHNRVWILHNLVFGYHLLSKEVYSRNLLLVWAVSKLQMQHFIFRVIILLNIPIRGQQICWNLLWQMKYSKSLYGP